jgi:sterol desaturase/sphingolipid hydroxylase (fatty acid hydroxylase superfamily)
MKVEDFFTYYGNTLISFGICSVIVTSPDRSVLSAVLGSCLMALNYYFSHRLLHQFPCFLNFHLNLHHDKVGLPRWIELTIESILELFYFMLFPVLLQYLFNDWIIPFSVILLLSMTYTTYHLYNYSILGSEDHGRHHKDNTVNFSPNFLDHLFDTNFDEKHEDLNAGIVNAVVCTLLTLLLKRYFNWTDLR